MTSATRIASVMSEQLWIHAATEAEAKDIENKLVNMRAGSKSAIHPRRDGASIFAACPIKTDLDPKAVIEIADSHRSVAFFDMFYQIDGTKSGMHHPDGILWIRDSQRQPCVYNEKVPLTAVAPTILEMLGVPQPSYMKGVSLYKWPRRNLALRDVVGLGALRLRFLYAHRFQRPPPTSGLLLMEEPVWFSEALVVDSSAKRVAGSGPRNGLKEVKKWLLPLL